MEVRLKALFDEGLLQAMMCNQHVSEVRIHHPYAKDLSNLAGAKGLKCSGQATLHKCCKVYSGMCRSRCFRACSLKQSILWVTGAPAAPNTA